MKQLLVRQYLLPFENLEPPLPRFVEYHTNVRGQVSHRALQVAFRDADLRERLEYTHRLLNDVESAQQRLEKRIELEHAVHVVAARPITKLVLSEVTYTAEDVTHDGGHLDITLDAVEDCEKCTVDAKVHIAKFISECADSLVDRLLGAKGGPICFN